VIVFMWWYRVGMKWLWLGAGRRELKELEKTTIDKRIFIQIKVCLREGKVMASSSEGGSSADVALRWKILDSNFA